MQLDCPHIADFGVCCRIFPETDFEEEERNKTAEQRHTDKYKKVSLIVHEEDLNTNDLGIYQKT